jgi:CheY-like chemotaxis protein
MLTEEMKGLAAERQLQKARVLLVDDKAAIRMSLGAVLTYNGFEVETAASVQEALKLIGSLSFDVLVSDLHMPHAGDGLTLVTATRHSNPKAVTIIFSGYPEMREAARAIVQQTDAVLLKPMEPTALVRVIRDRLAVGPPPPLVVETVAAILEKECQSTIEDWLERVNGQPDVICVHLGREERCAHLSHLLYDLIYRLRNPLPLGSHALVSAAAKAHGVTRCQQGYSAAMLVEESRILQVSIFQTLQNNLSKVDFSVLLIDVMSIADEVDSQLAQAMASFAAEASAGCQRSATSQVIPQD